MKRLRSLVLPSLLAAALAMPAHAGDPDPSVPAFVALKKDVEALRKDPEKKLYRHHYEKLIVRLQAVANTHKEGERADDAAFVAAQLLEELYFVSRLDSDRVASVEAFVSCAERFPSSSLVDDALVAAARLVADPAKKRSLFERVVAMGDKADLRGEAKRELQALPARDAPLREAIARVADAAPAKPAPAKHAAEFVAPASPAAEDAAPTKVAAVPATAKPASAGPRLTPVEVLPEAPPAGTSTRKVMVIKHEKAAGESVVTLRVSGDVGITRGEVPTAESGSRRVFYDLAPAKLGQRNIQPIEVNDGVIRRVRAGQYDTNVVRLVVELEGDTEPALHVVRRPFEVRLVVPIAPPSVDVVAGALGKPGPAPRPAGRVADASPAPSAAEVKKRIESGTPGGVSISQQLGLAVHRVVIDAGHGGNDTGAIGPTGVKEKDITLQLAERVREKLIAEIPDVEVIMTRSDDATLALQDRTNAANAAAADLFISIHCNASPYRRVRGVETYTLNITHDRYAMKLAARENAEAGEGSISDLEFILADLAMKSNVDDSVRLGKQVQRSIMGNLKRRWSDVPDLGLKHALFYVLMGTRMPSILVETSFLSNKTEEQRLASAAYQESIANGIVDGVRGFIEERQAFYQ
ncbi:MAG: N-acetylmuramoyl-L-alanine amidase [Deltaproteobacteria bacterium]|nr:N-acetylmuramoyl-L-alanine amidase [Deltaproteobacteria bacterium]